MTAFTARHWFFTWRTYGSWLPGEDGFVGHYRTWDGRRVKDNAPGLPATAASPGLARHARELMATDPVLLDLGQADVILAAVLEHAAFRQSVVDAVAVLSNHAHLVFGTPSDIQMKRTLADWKGYASRALNRSAGVPPANPERQRGGESGQRSRPVWWAEGGSTRVLGSESARLAAIQYVRDQHAPLVVWLSDEAQRLIGG